MAEGYHLDNSTGVVYGVNHAVITYADAPAVLYS